MASPDPRADRLTADDFIAYGSDSLDDTACLTASTSVPSAERAECIPSSASQGFKRGRPRPVEQKTAGTPQWYIKKVQDRTASRKQMADLQSLLQGTDTEYVDENTKRARAMSNFALQVDSSVCRAGRHGDPRL